MEEINNINNESVTPVTENNPTQPVAETPPKQNNIFKLLFIISILVVTGLVVVIFSLLQNQKQPIVTETNNQIEETIPTEVVKSDDIDINQIYQQALNIAKSQINLTVSLDNNFGTIWSTDDNKTIFIKDENFSFEANQKQEIFDTNKFNSETFNTLASSINKLLIDNDFSLNQKNTTKEGDYSFNSYESSSGNYKCVVYFPYQALNSASLKASLNFTCFSKEQLNSNYQEQISFIQDLNLKNSIIFDINVKNNEVILKLTDRERMKNTVINPNYYAYKSDSKWNYIFSGNDVCSCEDLIERNVPKEHWVGCAYKDNTYVKGNFNIE